MTNQYVASMDKELVRLHGKGNTPDEAFDDFINGGDFEEFCVNEEIVAGTDVEVSIYSIITLADAEGDDLEHMESEGYEWITADYYREVRTAIAPELRSNAL